MVGCLFIISCKWVDTKINDEQLWECNLKQLFPSGGIAVCNGMTKRLKSCIEGGEQRRQLRQQRQRAATCGRSERVVGQPESE
ncbi:hypothetical protein J6590_057356 [Homalodisca vitripennis]|nr:hypothetical protein J6590_057356 [Homalodisca vitripennis]